LAQGTVNWDDQFGSCQQQREGQLGDWYRIMVQIVDGDIGELGH
jgi:hypothetical protein